MVEIVEPNREFVVSKGTIVKEDRLKQLRPSLGKEIEVDKDFRDFIKGNISMDELFKKKELKNDNN